MTAAIFDGSFFGTWAVWMRTFGSHMEDVDFDCASAPVGGAGCSSRPQSRTTVAAPPWEWNNDTVPRIARNQVLLSRSTFAVTTVADYGRTVALGNGCPAAHGRGSAFVRGKIAGMREACRMTRQVQMNTPEKVLAEVLNRARRRSSPWGERQASTAGLRAHFGCRGSNCYIQLGGRNQFLPGGVV